MPDTLEQNLANHAKFDPPFHFVLAPITLANVIASIVAVVHNPGMSTGWCLVLSVAALLAVFKIRLYALKVQDRVIRLEERLRLSQLLPESTRSRIGELTVSQLIALRFASDAEIPALVEKTLAGGLKNSDIKKAIGTWRPDTFRI